MEHNSENEDPNKVKPQCDTYGCQYFSGPPIEGLPLPGVPPANILSVGQGFYLCPTHSPFQSAKSNFDKLFNGELKLIYQNLARGENKNYV